MSHFVTKCDCGAVIAQCRCPDPAKTETVVPQGCAACKLKVGMEAVGRVAADAATKVRRLSAGAITLEGLEAARRELLERPRA